MSCAFETIEEMQRAYYGGARDLPGGDGSQGTAAVPGAGYKYGLRAWTELNAPCSTYSLFPKFSWAGSPCAAGGALAGSRAFDARWRPRTAQLAFDLQDPAGQALQNGDIGDEWRLRHAGLFAGGINRAMLAGMEGQAARAAGSHGDAPGIESLDRIISSKDEADALGQYYDPWDVIDRRDSPAFDCTVESAGGDIGTPGDLLESTFVSAMRKSRRAGGIANVDCMFGSYEVYPRIQELFDPSARAGNSMGEALMETGVHGARSAAGSGVPVHVPSIYGVPFFAVTGAPSSGRSETGRIYGICYSDGRGSGVPGIGVGVAALPTYREIPLARRGMYHARHELVCDKFGGQFKIRDIRL